MVLSVKLNYPDTKSTETGGMVNVQRGLMILHTMYARQWPHLLHLHHRLGYETINHMHNYDPCKLECTVLWSGMLWKGKSYIHTQMRDSQM